MKNDCYALKNKEREKEKGKTHGDGHVMQVISSSSSTKIEEINAICDDDVDILVVDDEATYVEVNMSHSLAHTLLLDYGASFHVTPHREWFMKLKCWEWTRPPVRKRSYNNLSCGRTCAWEM